MLSAISAVNVDLISEFEFGSSKTKELGLLATMSLLADATHESVREGHKRALKSLSQDLTFTGLEAVATRLIASADQRYSFRAFLRRLYGAPDGQPPHSWVEEGPTEVLLTHTARHGRSEWMTKMEAVNFFRSPSLAHHFWRRRAMLENRIVHGKTSLESMCRKFLVDSVYASFLSEIPGLESELRSRGVRLTDALLFLAM